MRRGHLRQMGANPERGPRAGRAQDERDDDQHLLEQAVARQQEDRRAEPDRADRQACHADRAASQDAVPGPGGREGDAMKADTGFRARHATSFDRVVVVSDEDWMPPAVRALSFLLPGKARGFHVHDLAAAKTWLAEGVDT